VDVLAVGRDAVASVTRTLVTLDFAVGAEDADMEYLRELLSALANGVQREPCLAAHFESLPGDLKEQDRAPRMV